MLHEVSMRIRDQELTLETGKLAKQANGSTLIRCGGTVVLATCVMGSSPKMDLDYFPLQVNYMEKHYAIGKIPGGFIKREGRPRDKEILISRLIDRPIRPLFPEGFRNEVQIWATTLSADQVYPPDILGIIASSSALCVSDIPFPEPIGGVRISRVEGEILVNPTFEEIQKGDLELIVAGTKSAVLMIEGSAVEILEEEILEAIQIAHQSIIQIVDLQEELVRKIKPIKKEVDIFSVDAELKRDLEHFGKDRIEKVFFEGESKQEVEENMARFIEDALKELAEKWPERELEIKLAIQKLEHEVVRKFIVEGNRRVDDRNFDELRSISCEIEVLPRTHGSSLFTRGETQSLTVVTLGTEMDVQRFDDLDGEGTKNFMLHYNFPPFSVGEVGRSGGVSRREIGHGALADRALRSVLPDLEEFPYTIRVVSEILESNGSSSMATVCSASLALLDAGVPISNPVAGVAIGLVTMADQYRILTDIQGVEDHLGDMDFKVAGTRKGITGFQLDTKIEGIPFEIMQEAFSQAKKARVEILDTMALTIHEAREHLSEYAPKIISMQIPINKISELIGPGGRVIKKIIEETGANINVDDVGKVSISSKDETATQKAYESIRLICTDAEVGQVYEGKVKKITDFGAFIEILPGKDGLCHISKLSHKRVNRVQDILSERERVRVKCIGIDSMGRISLSMKDL